jgi:exosortase
MRAFRFLPPARRLRPEEALAALLCACLLWSYWPTLVNLVRTWARDPRYSHGFLVPPFAAYLFWSRRPPSSEPVRRTWTGAVLIAAGAALRLAGAYSFFDWLDAASLLPSLAGVCALLGGWAAVRRAWPAVAFLIFMIPLPFSVESALGPRMQRVATAASTFALQALGLDAVRSGNVIGIGEFKMGIVDACNGLGISYMCLACAIAAALTIDRPRLDRVVLVISAVPIALLVNVTRITATGVLHETLGRRVADVVYHDLAGWLLMPLALVALAVELKVLSFVFVEPSDDARAPAEGLDGTPVPVKS